MKGIFKIGLLGILVSFALLLTISRGATNCADGEKEEDCPCGLCNMKYCSGNTRGVCKTCSMTMASCTKSIFPWWKCGGCCNCCTHQSHSFGICSHTACKKGYLSMNHICPSCDFPCSDCNSFDHCENCSGRHY